MTMYLVMHHDVVGGDADLPAVDVFVVDNAPRSDFHVGALYACGYPFRYIRFSWRVNGDQSQQIATSEEFFGKLVDVPRCSHVYPGFFRQPETRSAGICTPRFAEYAHLRRCLYLNKQVHSSQSKRKSPASCGSCSQQQQQQQHKMY